MRQVGVDHLKTKASAHAEVIPTVLRVDELGSIVNDPIALVQNAIRLQAQITEVRVFDAWRLFPSS